MWLKAAEHEKIHHHNVSCLMVSDHEANEFGVTQPSYLYMITKYDR